ncbi:MAG: hypothetical protein DLM73_14270 [Chthoniobacterales bacterium]|nr:MAG: hypothetical protein DLM73_14270 [Chthoniobacterales bacterium]
MELIWNGAAGMRATLDDEDATGKSAMAFHRNALSPSPSLLPLITRPSSLASGPASYFIISTFLMFLH